MTAEPAANSLPPLMFAGQQKIRGGRFVQWMVGIIPA